jgi:hypothetical protein
MPAVTRKMSGPRQLLAWQGTVAYLLAAPSVPDEAPEKAVERAEGGEQVTTAVAKEIPAETRKKKRPLSGRRGRRSDATETAGTQRSWRGWPRLVAVR